MKNILKLPVFLLAGLLMTGALSSSPALSQDAPSNTMTVLHPDQEGALVVEQGGNVSIPKGTLWVHSKNKAAVKILNSAEINVERVGVAGGVQVARGAKASAKQNLKVAEATDALQDLKDTPPADLIATGIRELKGAEKLTLQPGVYDSLIIGGGAEIRMAPGVYVIQRKLEMSSSGTLRGEGVTIINQGDMKLEASGELTLSAPTEGPFKDIAFMQSRANTRSIKLGASAHMTVTGTVYIPNAPLLVANSAVVTCTNLAANTVQVSNSGTVQLK